MGGGCNTFAHTLGPLLGKFWIHHFPPIPVQGYYLKGTTLTQMKRFPEAEQALKQGLRYEPRNRELKSALSDVEAELSK